MAGSFESNSGEECVPAYPFHGELPDPQVQTFLSNFFRVSDNKEANELWVSSFTKDARVEIGHLKGKGEQEIRTLRRKMWEIAERRIHRVAKVFPGQFRSGDAERAAECEVMLYGDVDLEYVQETKRLDFAAHGVVRRASEGGQEQGWKFSSWRVYINL